MSERYGEYDLLRHIATGGMAEIHLARQSGLAGVGRLLIIKRMLPQLAVRNDFVQMFHDEARLTASLKHPNIVRVHELGETDGSFYIEMELVDGPHLGALFAHSLRAGAPLPTVLCCWVVARAADGLHYAHDVNDPATGVPLNLVHRDISPQNILVSRTGDVKVSDFGVAKATTQQTKTRTGIIKGKVAYMSPEQCLGDAIDRRTDVFALGIVLYELITRRRLFHQQKSDLLVMQKITGEDVPPPSSVRNEKTSRVVNPEIDAGLDAILQRALSRDVNGRFSTALELSEALDGWIAGRVNERSLGEWFEASCPALAPSLQLPPEAEPAAASLASSIERTVATPAVSGVGEALQRQTVASEATVVSSPLRKARTGEQHSDTERHTAAPGADGGVVPGAGATSTAGRDVDIAADEADGPDGAASATTLVARMPVPDHPPAAQSARPRAALALLVAALGAAAVAGIGSQVIAGAHDEVAADAAVPPPVGRLHVETSPSGVTIIANGATVLGRSPLDVDFPPGHVELQAQFADQPPRTVGADVVAGGTASATIAAWVPLVVTSVPSSAKVRVDGQLRGETPFDQGFLVEPGRKLVVRLEAAGFAPWEEERTARPGEPLRVAAKLQAPRSDARTPAPSSGQREEFGAIKVKCEPWANVRLGDVALGEAPFGEKRVRAGRQTLMLTNPEVGFRDAFVVTVPANKVLTVIVRYEKQGAAWVPVQKSVR